MGFRKKEQRNLRWYLRKINLVYIFLLLFFFSLFAFYENMSNLLFADDKIDIFSQNLEELSFYFWNFDKGLSEIILKMDDIVQSYKQGDNVLVDKK
ncbi:MAG: hypothetical protein GXP45_07650 [bacterium]|nr:hypothetical protein [bacterium]